MRYYSVFGDEDIFYPPWPVWEDSAVNAMKWAGDPKVKKNWVFEDPIDHGAIPPSISVGCWKRPDVSQDETDWILAPEEKPVDLVKHNSHLLKYKVMAWIISSIQSLEEHGRKQPFDVDYQNNYFFYNGGPNWKPWYHIYALTKVGRGTAHSLQLNRAGLYLVRLYYLGSWRRVLVDDYLPYSEDGQLLLPRTRNKYNLWPQILSKALLRIASLSWTSVDEVADFSPITCLTGWTCYKLDCRLTSIDDVWNAIQMNIISRERGKEEKKPCLTTPSQTCLNDSFQFYCSDNPKMKTLFISLSRTENELQKVSPAEGHLMWIVDASIETKNDVEQLSLWKKVRWIKWAQKNHRFTDPLCNLERRVKVYSAMRKRYLPNPYTEENFASLTEKIVSGEITYGNIKMLLHNEVGSVSEEIHDQDLEEDLIFNFSSLYPHIRELEVYYKSGNFQYSEDCRDLEKVVVPSSNHEKSRYHSIKAPSKQTLQNKTTIPLHESNKTKCFFLYSNSEFCKNFLVSLSICKHADNTINSGYLACEEYNWKSRVMGKLIFSLWTFGTKTQFLRLGNGVRVCRFWYQLPDDYFISIKGNAHFEILQEESLHLKLSHYTQALLDYGGNISLSFSQMRFGKLGMADHYSLINYFKSSFYPPLMNTLEAEYKATLLDHFNEEFDDSLAELIFENSGNMLSAAACLEAFRLLFNNEELGKKQIETFSQKEKYVLEQCRLEVISNQKNAYSGMLNEKIKSFKKSHQLHIADNGEVDVMSVNTSQKLKSEHFSGSKQLDVTHEDIAILDSPEYNIELLRKILNKKKEYLHLYSFQNELDLKLKFREYSGTTEITPLHKWFLVTRLIVNVHSETEVPCVLKVKTSYTKVTLVVFETDTCKQILCPFDVNNVYYLSRKKGGYVVLVYGYPAEDMIKETLIVFWKIKVIGIDEGNVLHYCYKTPVLCKPHTIEPLGIHVQTITGFYFPNIDNIIGRFQIKCKTSAVATLYISLSRENIQMRVVLRGCEKEICVAEGRGAVMIPVALLDKTIAVKSTQDPEKFIFRGEIQLVGQWKLDKFESLFEEKLRDLPQKDILSFNDFKDLSMDDFSMEDKSSEEGDYIEPEERERMSSNFKDRKKTMKRKPTGSNFNEDSDEDSEDMLMFSEKEFREASPFGLVSYSPHWRISMILDELDKDGTSLEHDDLVCKAYMMFTRSWEENDPGRAERAEEIRNEFLDFGKENFIKMQLDPEDLSLSDVSEGYISTEKATKQTTGKETQKYFKQKKQSTKNRQRKIARNMSREIHEKEFSNGKNGNSPESKSKSLKSDEELKILESSFKKPSLRNKRYRVMWPSRKLCLLKSRNGSSTVSLGGHNYKELRSAGHGIISKPLAPIKFKKLGIFRCPPRKSTFSSESVVSSTSAELTDEKLSIESQKQVWASKCDAKLAVIQPQVSLLAKLPSRKHISAVSKLFKVYCGKTYDRTKIEDKSAPNVKSLTKTLLKKYRKPSGHTELSTFNLDIFDFDLTPKRPIENLTIKEIMNKIKKSNDLNTFIEDVIEPSLWYVSKRTIPDSILYTPPTFISSHLGKSLTEEILKNEADDYISYLLDAMTANLQRLRIQSPETEEGNQNSEKLLSYRYQ